MLISTTLCLYVAVIGLLHAADGDGLPEALSAWKDPAYTQRYVLRCEAPGEAGNMGLHLEPGTASVLLPLRTGSGLRGDVESVLLIGEDGNVHPVSVQPVPGTSDVEVYFRTQPGLRRFCLYAGAPAGTPNASGTRFAPVALKVKLRGRTAPADFVYNPKQPLTVERFTQLEQRGDGLLGIKDVDNIDDPETRFFDIKVSQFGHIQRTDNPQRFTALYEGFLRVPVTGKYRFALDTLGAAHLLLNGQAVISADTPDAARLPFVLEKTIELAEGVHRIGVHFCEANPEGSSNMELQRFGLRLHWQPPYASGLMCIPPQSFAKSIPAVVTRLETAVNSPQPFVHLEVLAHIRSGHHRGTKEIQERVLVSLKSTGVPPGAKLNLVTGQDSLTLDETTVCRWIPAGTEIKAVLAGNDSKPFYTRVLNVPKLPAASTLAVDLEGELAVKSSPEFLYPDETAHLHMESLLSPAPVIVPKARTESNLVPPPPRPMGEYTLHWRILTPKTSEQKPAAGGTEDATPLAFMPEDGARPGMPRRKLLLSLPAKEWQKHCVSGNAQIVIELRVGGIEVERVTYRLLHSDKDWPGKLVALAGELRFTANTGPRDPAPANDASTPVVSEIPPLQERVMILVPREDESEHRRLAPLKTVARRDLGTDALFVGDALIEGVTPKPGELHGLATQLSKQLPGYSWKGVCIVGPHRKLPIFQMVAEVENFAQASGGKLPALVFLSLGGGDAMRQTPLHTFERALDLLLDRLHHAGARRIIVGGVLPEPMRERQAEPYQGRVADVLRQHHLDGVDLLKAWQREKDWDRRYLIEGALYGPVPNAAALEEIARMLKDRL